MMSSYYLAQSKSTIAAIEFGFFSSGDNDAAAETVKMEKSTILVSVEILQQCSLKDIQGKIRKNRIRSRLLVLALNEDRDSVNS